MENVAAQISEATENWEAVQEHSTQTAKLAEEIAQGIAASVKEHDTFMAQAGNEEVGALKLEVEKLRRAEVDWVNTLVATLDLVYRLERSAVASGKEQFIRTMGQFQGQCRDTARRVGLVAFEAETACPSTATNTRCHRKIRPRKASRLSKRGCPVSAYKAKWCVSRWWPWNNQPPRERPCELTPRLLAAINSSISRARSPGPSAKAAFTSSPINPPLRNSR